MARIRLALMAAVASGVIGVGYAYAAGGNEAAIRQEGQSNAARINQSAGQSNQFNSTGASDTSAALQMGNGNSIDVLQEGTGNQAGLIANRFNQLDEIIHRLDGSATLNRAAWGIPAEDFDSDATSGIAQIGDNNEFTAVQEVGGNVIGGVVQLAVRPTGALKNTLEITQQGGSGNEVSQVMQATSSDKQNYASITQTGSNNKIAAINQIGVNTAGATTAINSIIANISGTNNGTSALTGYALSSGATTSELNQFGADNSITLNITGASNNNAFGVSQTNFGGGRNTLQALTITGNDNQLGVSQDADGVAGNHNQLTISSIIGDGNNIGVSQLGSNQGTIDLKTNSNNNQIGLSQTGTNLASVTIFSGDGNNFDLTQEDNNQLTINATGSSNLLKTSQSGSAAGTDNTLNATIYGNSNNSASFDVAGVAGATGLVAGELIQTGYGNQVTINVGSSTTNSNNNAFALTQSGNSNEAVISISEGDYNQVALLQSGNGNYSNITQIGSSNIVGVTQ